MLRCATLRDGALAGGANKEKGIGVPAEGPEQNDGKNWPGGGGLDNGGDWLATEKCTAKTSTKSRFALELTPGKDSNRRASLETKTTINHLSSFNMLIFPMAMQ